MKANLRSLKPRRVYSEAIKKQIVKDFETGKYSVYQLERLHGINNVTIYKWIYKYSTFNKKGYHIVEHKKSSQNKVRELEGQIKELQAALGRKQIQIDYLETMMEVAKEELDIDIKKNFGTLQSKSSANKK